VAARHDATRGRAPAAGRRSRGEARRRRRSVTAALALRAKDQARHGARRRGVGPPVAMTPVGGRPPPSPPAGGQPPRVAPADVACRGTSRSRKARWSSTINRRAACAGGRPPRRRGGRRRAAEPGAVADGMPPPVPRGRGGSGAAVPTSSAAAGVGRGRPPPRPIPG